MKNLLIIEDNFKLASSIKEFLGNKNYNTTIEIDGLLGYQKAIKPLYDIVIIDIDLPRKNGIDILLSLRSNQVEKPIILLTAKNSIDDIITGFEKGADEYIPKPFSLFEFKARLDRLVIRPPTRYEDIICFKGIEVNSTNYKIYKDNTEIKLRKKEFDILRFLLTNKGKAYTRDQLFSNVWPFNEDRTPGIIDVYIKLIRNKIGLIDGHNLIKTVYGVGYMID